jgi:hypothetical protein
LATSNDADLLKSLQTNFPKTAQALKQYHVDALLNKALSKAAPGETISATGLRTALKKMSPELRDFAVSPEARTKIEAVGQMLDKIKESRLGNTGGNMTRDSLTEHLGGTMAIISALTHHNPVLALGGMMAKSIFKDTPDALRLAMLKFMGTNKPVSAGAFKTAVDSLQAVIKGEQLVGKTVKGIFKASDKPLISEGVSLKDREKLDKMVVMAQTHPEMLQNLGGDLGHYMPEHTTALAATAATALSFLNSQRPNPTPKSPLDTKLPADPAKQAEYNRLLDIAAKPLVIMDKVKNGSVTSKEVAGLKTMYPDLYTNLVTKISDEMNNHLTDGGTVPYKTRIGMSLFMGMPMDSTLTGASILAAQPKHKQDQPQPQQGGQGNGVSAKTGNSLNKMVKGYQTPGQAREQHAQKD